MKGDLLFLAIDNEEMLYSFNVGDRNLDQSTISRNIRAANGYGAFIEVEKEKKLVAILGHEDFVYFLFDKNMYRLDDQHLTVVQKDGFLKNTFQLFVNGQKKIDIRYKQIWDIENDIFLDLRDWLDIKPREKLLIKLSKYSEFLGEIDLIKRSESMKGRN